MGNLYQLRIKTKNAQIICPLGHKLRVIKLSESEIVLYCKKCNLYYPFPGRENNNGV